VIRKLLGEYPPMKTIELGQRFSFENVKYTARKF
jgi:hypothetical protein